jgi:hypothetical protein
MILTKIYINNEQIDLTDEVSIPLNFNIADIREPEKRSTTWSKTVVLPGTTFNNQLFSNIWNVNAVINSTGTTNFTPNFNPNLKAIAEITYNEATQFKGICQLLNVNVTDKYEIQYEVAFFGELQNVYQFFNNKYLRDLDFSEYNHKYTLFNQQLSWNNTNGYVYPMIDYGFQINSRFNVTNMFPALFVKTIIDKMFNDAGFTYQSSFFNSEIFKKLVIPYSGGSALKLTNQQVTERTGRASKTSTQVITLDKQPITLSDGSREYATRLIYQDKTTAPNSDIGNNFSDQQGGTNYQTFTIEKTGTYTLNAFVRANVTHFPQASTVDLATRGNQLPTVGKLLIIKNPANYGSYFTNNGSEQILASRTIYLKSELINEGVPDSFMITCNTVGGTITSGTTSLTADGQLSISANLNANDIIQVRILKDYGVSYLLGFSNETAFYRVGTVNEQGGVNSYCKLNILQDSYFSVALADTNIQENDDVEVNAVLPDKIKQSEFFNSIVKAFNLFVEVDKGNANKLIIEPRPTFYSSGTTQDFTDKLDYSKETKIIPLGELNNKSYVFSYKEDTDYFNSNYKTTYNEIYGQKKYDILNDFLKGEVRTELIFSPTPLVDTIGHDRVISKIYTLESNGTIKPTQSNIRLLYWGGLKTTNVQWQHIATSGTTFRSDYPYAGHLDDVNNPTFDLNFGTPYQVYYTPIKYTGNNLYNKYWRDYIEQIADKDSKIFTGYFLLNEFDIQNLDFRDTYFFENDYWRLNKIIDYDRINNQPTKCEFIKLKTLPDYVDDIGVDINGGVKDLDTETPAPTARLGTTFNNNQIADGAIVSGRNNIVSSGDGVIVSGESNVIGVGSKNLSILASTGVTILGGVSNVSVTNSSGITVTESNVTYNNGIKTLNNVSYKKYVALLSQSGVTAPTVVELETTMSSGITSSYYLVGEYLLLSNAEFTANKTFVMINQTGLSMTGIQAIILANRIGNSEILIQVADTMGTGYMDNVLLDTQIEIRVYS